MPRTCHSRALPFHFHGDFLTIYIGDLTLRPISLQTVNLELLNLELQLTDLPC